MATPASPPVPGNRVRRWVRPARLGLGLALGLSLNAGVAYAAAPPTAPSPTTSTGPASPSPAAATPPPVVVAQAPTASPTVCAAPRSTGDLSRALDLAEAAFERREKAGVLAAATEAEADLLCLGEALTPGSAARFHRVQGLRAFLSQDQAGASRSFAAAKAVEPAYVLPVTMVPMGHPARALYDGASAALTTTEPIPPTDGTVRVDGRELGVRPTDRPVVLQRLDAAGAVAGTWLLQPGTPLPAMPAPPARPVVAAVEPAAALPPAPVEAHHGPNKPLLIGAIAGVAVAGGLYGAGGVIKGEYDGLDRVAANEARFDSLYGANHGVIIGSAATLGLAVLAGTLSFAVQW